MSKKLIGPDIKRLLAHFIALEAIPDGGGIGSGMNFLIDPERRRQGIEKAMSNLEKSLAAIKSAPDNPYGDDDEAIASAILDRIEKVTK